MHAQTLSSKVADAVAGLGARPEGRIFAHYKVFTNWQRDEQATKLAPRRGYSDGDEMALVYEGRIEITDAHIANPNRVLEEIFWTLNLAQRRPVDYFGEGISMGDVIEVNELGRFAAGRVTWSQVTSSLNVNGERCGACGEVNGHRMGCRLRRAQVLSAGAGL